jgi:hypothetical protein
MVALQIWPSEVMKGGNRTFAAGANQIEQLKESRRSERRSSFFVVQTQRKSAASPLRPMLRYTQMAASSSQIMAAL